MRFANPAVIALLVLASVAVPGQCAADPGVEMLFSRIGCVTFHSEVLGRDMRYCVVLPQDYSYERTDWPVLYLLHGRGRTCRSLVDDPVARSHLLNAGFVIVLPDGEDGWYIDSPVAPESRYSTYLNEVIKAAQRRYGLSRDFRCQGICGWSMGGYGAVRFAVSNPGRFGFVAPIIGLLDFPRSGLPEGQDYKVPAGTFGTDEAVWKEWNPIHQAERLQGSDILIITADEAFDRTMNENFHQRLDDLEIAHSWKVLKGAHKLEVVINALPLVIDRAATAFGTGASGE